MTTKEKLEKLAYIKAVNDSRNILLDYSEKVLDTGDYEQARHYAKASKLIAELINMEGITK